MNKLEKLTPREVFALSPAERQARQDLYKERHQAFEAAWCKSCTTCFEMGNHGSVPSLCPFNMPEEIKEEFSDLL